LPANRYQSLLRGHLPPSLPYRPSYLFITTLALFLFPIFLLCHSCIHSIAFLCPFITYQSTESVAFARIDWNPEPRKNRSDISADRNHQHSALRDSTRSLHKLRIYILGTEAFGGLKNHSLPRHSRKVATTLTRYLGEA
jgi:hypothetical protein